MSDPQQGSNGKRRGVPRSRGVFGPRRKGGPRGRNGPKPHSSHRTPATRKINVQDSPHRPPPPQKCYDSLASWKECIENQQIPEGTKFNTHHTRLNAERQVAEKGSDYQIDPTRAPRRHNVGRDPSHSQTKSLYISRLVKYR